MVLSPQKLTFLACPGHALALAGPGAGKTHVALIKAQQQIASGTLKPGQKVLFLSFARPTVARILEKAAELISQDELKHLEINTYHGFAWSILRSHGYLLSTARAITLLPPPEAAAHFADVDASAREQEMLRLFEEEGRLHFDMFARLVAQLFQRGDRLATIYCDAYPTVILDEFQDTNADEWALVRQLGRHSRLIALGDPDQRIYEFRGADPRRLGDFVEAFQPSSFDFSGENHRSSGTDITTFGNDLLTGRNRGRTYTHVKIVRYGFRRNQSPHFRAKAEVLAALRRLRDQPNTSVSVLVPSKAFMLQFSQYLSSELDGLPAIRHDVAMDAESPSLAANVIAVLLGGGSTASLASRLVATLHTHIRGRGGNKAPAQAEMGLAGAIGIYMSTGKIRGKNRELIVTECQRIAAVRANLILSGNPEEDWAVMQELIATSTAPQVARVAEDARFLRLLHRGSALRTALTVMWRTRGDYVGAEAALREALLQEHFVAAQKEWRGLHVMTIHKAKGKEFDEVVIYEGTFSGRILAANADSRRIAQSRLALRVGVTRAIRRATIVTPLRDGCPFL
ncbi:ATP-dependent helicase [Achromobacter xylosoxidans]|uniref:DNA 3'-5' helicase II n=1 Tax=Achromobacter spanius TaxID=217203 RepID=A0AA42LN03_9BURK|nr:ATP-dependent helicase [Achromobacter spanius]MDH0734805.1 ATP-dependent helicase [Achromobacter spanius]